MVQFTEKELRYLLQKGFKINKNSPTKPSVKKQGKPKYSNNKVRVNGIVFASELEAKRYCQLKLLERGGAIHNLELQKAFVLQPGFKTSEGKHIRPIKYVADFVYVDNNGVTVVEDTKGYKTKEYLLKRKMFLYRYPDLVFREVYKCNYGLV